MNTLSRAAIAVVGMTALAAAQPKSDPKADPKATEKPAEKPAESKPPQEVVDMARAASGTWRCKGQGMDHAMKMADMSGTMRIKAELGGWWVRATFESKIGKEPFAFESYTTFDPSAPSANKWRRIMVESGGNWATGESAGIKDGKVDWEMKTHSPQMGDGTFRDHEDYTDPKAGAKMWGEFSNNGTWVKVYEVACKK